MQFLSALRILSLTKSNPILPRHLGVLVIVLTLTYGHISCRANPQGVTAVAPADRLGLKIEVDKVDCLKGGDMINIRYSAENQSSTIYSVDSMDKPTLDIRITRRAKLLAEWTKQFPDKIVHQLEWQPGETKTIEMTFTVPEDQFAPGETLDVVGWLHDPRLGPGKPDTFTVVASLCLGSRSY